MNTDFRYTLRYSEGSIKTDKPTALTRLDEVGDEGLKVC